MCQSCPWCQLLINCQRKSRPNHLPLWHTHTHTYANTFYTNMCAYRISLVLKDVTTSFLPCNNSHVCLALTSSLLGIKLMLILIHAPGINLRREESSTAVLLSPESTQRRNARCVFRQILGKAYGILHGIANKTYLDCQPAALLLKWWWEHVFEIHLASPLLEFDLDEQNEADQRHNHKERQEDAHVEIFRGLLWKRRATKH